MNDPGAWTDDDHVRYFQTLLKLSWGSMSPRQRKRLKKQEHLLFLAIEGIMKYDRR